MSSIADPTVAIVAIGRNEGQRLVDCLASLEGRVARIVYVDSGSLDNSVQNARDAGAEVVSCLLIAHSRRQEDVRLGLNSCKAGTCLIMSNS